MKHKINYASYIRASTEEQSQEHQREDIADWLNKEGIDASEVQFYEEYGSGAKSERDEFQSLIDDIESGKVQNVIVWEISRIARKGFLAQKFFDACEENGVVVKITNGSVREVRPDGTGRLVADIIASVSAEERRNLIRRTESGIRQARKQGKWVGKPPVGFTTEGGYLKPIITPDYSEGETGYFDMIEAVEKIDSGKSYNKTAKETPNVTRQTLSSVYQDKGRRSWYLEQSADDERVEEAMKKYNIN